jgi:hypothetical protein
MVDAKKEKQGPHVVKLNLLVLRTQKLEEMREFYSAVGASFEREQHEHSSR